MIEFAVGLVQAGAITERIHTPVAIQDWRGVTASEKDRALLRYRYSNQQISGPAALQSRRFVNLAGGA